jgi:hypothetical protein
VEWLFRSTNKKTLSAKSVMKQVAKLKLAGPASAAPKTIAIFRCDFAFTNFGLQLFSLGELVRDGENIDRGILA